MTRGWAVKVPPGYAVADWLVGAPIASGSWGSVYDAWPAGHGEGSGPAPAAVKFLPTGTTTQRQLAHMADMARREREAYRSLCHPRLLGLLDVVVVDDGEHPELDGAVALVTERAAESLADAVARAAGKPVAAAPRLLTEICEGLAHMHAAGWVHGDLKPANVLLMADGSARLADFGLSAELDGTHGYAPPVGSSDYLPPERWSEPLTERGIAVRESADIWAFGVIACLLLTGRMPFPGPTAKARASVAAAYAESGRRPPLAGSLPPGWRTLIEDCLAADHAARGRGTAGRLLERLGELRASPPLASPPPRVRGKSRRWPVLTAAAVVTAAATANVALVLATSQPEPDYSRYLRQGTDIPMLYQASIVEAGTMCSAPGVSPALVAAILKAESGFDPRMSNPATRSYGIAGWTPRELREYTGAGEDPSQPLAIDPWVAIPAVGRYLCKWAPELSSVPGDPAVNLAAAYRTTAHEVVRDKGVPSEAADYAVKVRRYVADYQPGR